MKDENYWSLVLESGVIAAGVWKITDSTVDIHSVSKSRNFDEHELVEVADTVLSDAIKSFPEDEKEPSKTIFGVPPYWVESGTIKKDYLEKIRKVCVDLSLSPSGFVVLPEAIAHTIKVEEGSPLNGIIIGVGDKLVDVSLFKLGNLVGTVNVGKSVSIIDDIIEGLVRFSVKDSLPTRIILYGSDEKELEETKQALLSTDWGEKASGHVKFMHLPQVEVLRSQEKTIAVSVAGASEMAEIKSVKFNGQVVESEVSTQESHEEANVSPTEDLTPADIGFVVDEDIADTDREEPKFGSAEIEERETYEHPAAKKSGFKLSLPKFTLPAMHKKKEEREEDHTLRKINRTPVSVVKKIAVTMVVLLVVGVTGVGAYWWYIPKAEVIVMVSPKTLEEEQSIILDENIDQADTEKLTFPIKKVEVEVSGDKSKQTTGTQTVGEKAKGEVTIRNGTSQGVQFAAGTKLTGPGSLKFSLDESASVSAALSPTEPGSVTAKVTADDIGANYNLASGESLSIGNYPKSEVDGVVAGSFSGGTSREIVAVSQTDLNVLAEELEEELKQKGLSDLESKTIDMRFIPDSVETEVLDRDFSNSVGDEASTVSLAMSVRVTGLAIPNEMIDTLAQTILADQVPSGFKLKREQIETVFELTDTEAEGVYEFDLSLTANLLPEVNTDDIINNVAGKYPPAAQNYLQTIPGYSSAEITINPRFPGRLGILPFVKKNISVEIVAER